MGDNVTATEAVRFTSLAIPTLSAIIGAAAALFLREVWEHWRRPRLTVDFEERDKQKPYILDLTIGPRISNVPSKAKFIRLVVHNNGRKPAMDCEAKMVIIKGEDRETLTPVLHWARRDHIIYETPERIYAPIHVNRADEEPLDLFSLPYEPGKSLGPGAWIESMSARPYQFERNTTYRIQVTVYGNNTVSKPFQFTLHWDGTLEGFDNAFMKGEKEGQQTQYSVSKREFLTTGIIFFLFSITLYVYRGSQFVFEFWKWTWHGPTLVSSILNVVTIFVLAIGALISVSCLTGTFKPSLINNTLNRFSSHRRLNIQTRDAYLAFFSLAFLLNFYVAFVQKLVGVAKNPIVFLMVFAIGLIWTYAIATGQGRR